MPPPRGGGALLRNLSDKNALSSAFQSGQNATQNAGGAATNLTPQEQLLAGTLELDPENDPVVYTTDYGLDIKWHMVGEATNIINHPNKISSGSKFESYAYFRHADVNWVIIGICDDFSSVPINAKWVMGSDATVAGDLLKTVSINGQVVANVTMSDIFPKAILSDELDAGEVLCLAQNMFTDMSKFNSSDNCYYNSTLMTTMNTFYNNNLTDLPIAEKTLKTVWTGASDTTNGSNLPETYKIFPLAGANTNESFYVLNYLTSGSDAMLQSYRWWLRSGIVSKSNGAYYVNTDGTVTYNYTWAVSNSYGVRPAFVLKI
ncbi:MAG: DUF6273 domain-containing protein [Clostridia bacterium]